jgi:excinuclease UvrABC nuclease subunit
MAKGKTRTAKFNAEGIESLPKDKPVVYRILDSDGENIYTGVAKRGRVSERLAEHLPGGPDPIRGAAKVRIEQKTSINEAKGSEERIIKRSKPKYNKKGK